MKNKKSTPPQEFVDSLINDPKEIIAWARREIKEYESLIKILEKTK